VAFLLLTEGRPEQFVYLSVKNGKLEYEGKEVITTLKTVTLRKVLAAAYNAAVRVQKPSKKSSRIKEGAGSVQSIYQDNRLF
jgi:hypothetical protein